MGHSTAIMFGAALCLANSLQAGPVQAVPTANQKEGIAPLYDLTDTDLATIPDVDSRRISVFGVMLGEPREMVLKRFGKDARRASWNTNLLLVRLSEASDRVRGAGLVLSFDDKDRVASIDLETGTRTGELPDVLANKLRGKTRALFLKYSEALRLEVFGPEAKKYRIPNPPLTVYQYPLRGFQLGVYRDDQGNEHISGLLLRPPAAGEIAPTNRSPN